MNMYHRVHYDIVHEVRYNIVLYDILPCYTIWYCIKPHNKILYHIIQ